MGTYINRVTHFDKKGKPLCGQKSMKTATNESYVTCQKCIDLLLKDISPCEECPYHTEVACMCCIKKVV